jgi:hypothetical protein
MRPKGDDPPGKADPNDRQAALEAHQGEERFLRRNLLYGSLPPSRAQAPVNSADTCSGRFVGPANPNRIRVHQTAQPPGSMFPLAAIF